VVTNFSAADLNRLPSIARGEAKVLEVPRVVATAESLRGYGRLATDFHTTQVDIVPWPKPNGRPLVAGTGDEGGVAEDIFVMERKGEVQYATTHAVKRSYITGWFGDPATASESRTATATRVIYTHEANYHPDGGQVFSPRNRAAFVALLARPGDDVRLEDFVAFHFDGTFGVHIDPGVWHQPVFPLAAEAVFDDKQGRIHACVAIDFLTEFGTYLAVPLVG
jgi:ureidoglycolate lyase